MAPMMAVRRPLPAFLLKVHFLHMASQFQSYSSIGIRPDYLYLISSALISLERWESDCSLLVEPSYRVHSIIYKILLPHIFFLRARHQLSSVTVGQWGCGYYKGTSRATPIAAHWNRANSSEVWKAASSMKLYYFPFKVLYSAFYPHVARFAKISIRSYCAARSRWLIILSTSLSLVTGVALQL